MPEMTPEVQQAFEILNAVFKYPPYFLRKVGYEAPKPRSSSTNSDGSNSSSENMTFAFNESRISTPDVIYPGMDKEKYLALFKILDKGINTTTGKVGAVSAKGNSYEGVVAGTYKKPIIDGPFDNKNTTITPKVIDEMVSPVKQYFRDEHREKLGIKSNK